METEKKSESRKWADLPEAWRPDAERVLGISPDRDVYINFNQYNETRGGLIVDHKKQEFALWAGQGLGPDTGHAERTSWKKIVGRAAELRRRGYSEGVADTEHWRTALINNLPEKERRKIIKENEAGMPRFMKRQGFAGAEDRGGSRDSIAAAKSALRLLSKAGVEVSWNRGEFQKVLANAEKLNKMAAKIETVKKLGEALAEKQMENETLKGSAEEKVLGEIGSSLEQVKEYIPRFSQLDRASVLWFRDEDGRNTNFGITRTIGQKDGEIAEEIKFVEFDHYTTSDRMVLNEVYNFTTKEFDDNSRRNHGVPRFSIEKDVLRFRDSFVEAVKENLQNRYDMLEQKNNGLLMSLTEKEKSEETQKNPGGGADTIAEDFKNLDLSLRFNRNFEIPSDKLGADVSVFPGSTGKSGMGIRRLIEDRSKNDNLTQDQITALTALVLDCVRNGEITRDGQNRCEITKGGIVAIVRKDFDDEEKNWILTGFAYNEKSGKEKNREATEAIETVIARYGQSPDYSYFRSQVGAVMSSLGSNITWESNSVGRKPPRLMRAMQTQGLRDAENKPLLDKICDALEANGFGMRWGDESFDCQYKYRRGNKSENYLVSTTFATSSKELLESLVGEMEAFDPDEFTRDLMDGSEMEEEAARGKFEEVAYALERDMQRTLPALKELRREAEFGKDLYADLKTAVRAFESEDFGAVKMCDGFEPGVSAQKGAWEISSGGYDRTWQIYFTDGNGVKSEFCSRMKGAEQPVVITNHGFVRDAGLSPFKALASVRDALGEGADAVFPQLDEPTVAQYQKHIDAGLFGMVGFTGEWNEDGALVYSTEKWSGGLLGDIEDILNNSNTPVTGDLSEEIAHGICGKMQDIVCGFETGERGFDLDGGYVVADGRNRTDREKIRTVFEQAIRDSLKEGGVGSEDSEDLRGELAEAACDFWEDNRLAKFRREMMPEINYSVERDGAGGCVITDLGTGRDVYLQPGDEANRMLGEYERGEATDRLLSEYFAGEDGKPPREAEKKFSAGWLEKELREYGFTASAADGRLELDYETGEGFVCNIDRFDFSGEDDLKNKFLDLADGFRTETFARENGYDSMDEEETEELSGAADDVGMFLKNIAGSIRSMDAPKARFMRRGHAATEDDYEKELNRQLQENYSDGELLEKYEYLVERDFDEEKLTAEMLAENIRNGTMGSVLRKYDETLFSVGYEEYLNEFLPEVEKENIRDIVQILEDSGLDAIADLEKMDFEIGYTDEDGNYLSAASFSYEDSADLAEKIRMLGNDFSAEDFADDRDTGDAVYGGYTVSGDDYKNYLEFCRHAADSEMTAETAADIITDWHGMQLVDRDFLEDHLIRLYVVEAGLDREEYKAMVTDDCVKNYGPLMKISSACGFDGEQMATVFREWRGTDIFSREFMENYFEDELGMEKDSAGHQKLVSAGEAISDALEDAAGEISAKYIDGWRSMRRGGIVYGIAFDGKVLLNPDAFPFLGENGIDEEIAGRSGSAQVLAEALPHEWTHLWDEYTMRANPDLWDRWVKIVRDTRAYDRLEHSPEYSGDVAACRTEKEKTDYIASELHARAAGKFGRKILERIAREDGKVTKESMKRWMYEAGEYIAGELGLMDETGFSAEKVPPAEKIIEDAKRLEASTADWDLVELSNRGDDYRRAVYGLAKNSIGTKTENEIKAEAKGVEIGLRARRAEDAEVMKKMLANPFKDLVGGKQITRLDLTAEYMRRKIEEVFTPSELQKDGLNDAAKPKAERAKTVTLPLRNGRKFRITHSADKSCGFSLLDRRTGEYSALGESVKIKGNSGWIEEAAEKAAARIIDSGGLPDEMLEDFEMTKSSRTATRDPKPVTVKQLNSFLGTKYQDAAEIIRKTGATTLARAMRTAAQGALLADWGRSDGARLAATAERMRALAGKTAADIVYGKYEGLSYARALENFSENARAAGPAQSPSDGIARIEEIKRKAVSATHRFDVDGTLLEMKRRAATEKEKSPEAARERRGRE